MEKKVSPIKEGITHRAWIVYGLFVFLGLLIIGRILYIQYGPDGETLRAVAEGTRTFRWAEQEAERGNILAYDGRLLATSSPMYEIRMDFKATGLTDSLFYRHLDALSEALAKFFGDKSKQQYKNLLDSRRQQAKTGNQRVFRIAPRRVDY
ncbi:MAG: hypothetical protein LUD68_02600 [Rikenellaceae bacterium]|nr:hypothetical protein [Rikenellaceae bacterium]